MRLLKSVFTGTTAVTVPLLLMVPIMFSVGITAGYAAAESPSVTFSEVRGADEAVSKNVTAEFADKPLMVRVMVDSVVTALGVGYEPGVALGSALHPRAPEELVSGISLFSAFAPLAVYVGWYFRKLYRLL